MGRPIIPLTGQRFKKLEVLGLSGTDPRYGALWSCKCDCGGETVASGAALRNGQKGSCGCLHNEALIRRSTRHGHAPRGKRERLYTIWKGMRQRCTDQDFDGYKNYGGRGVSFTSEWEDYSRFRDWALNSGYQSHLTLDRRDNDGNYMPNNCRWATYKEQAANKRPLSRNEA